METKSLLKDNPAKTANIINYRVTVKWQIKGDRK